MLENQAKQNRADLAQKENELDFLKDQHRSQTQEYQELLEMKVVLDMEITAYRTLLEGEESRLGLDQRNDSGYTSEVGTGSEKKRKWMFQEEECMGSMICSAFTQPGSLFIEPMEKELKFIKITNKGEEMVSLDGCKLVCTSEGKNRYSIFQNQDKFH